MGAPAGLVVFDEASDLKGSISDSRLLIVAILLAFLLLALASSRLRLRALQRQIGELLERGAAARQG